MSAKKSNKKFTIVRVHRENGDRGFFWRIFHAVGLSVIVDAYSPADKPFPSREKCQHDLDKYMNVHQITATEVRVKEEAR